jgi:GntR family transcriptional regulator, galactonate operon transcriptional repressor
VFVNRRMTLPHRRLYPSQALHGQLVHDIGRQVVSGVIGQGEFLPREAELSKQFAVSRQAVREALKVLAAKGLVKSRRRTGTHVLPRSAWNLLDPDVLAWHSSDSLPRDFFNDLIELRRLIEPAAAEMAARRGDPDHVAVMAAALDNMRRIVNDEDAFHLADIAFHRALFAASGNSLIDRLSTIVAPLLEASFRAQGNALESLDAAVALHDALLDAIASGDGPGARKAMEIILDEALNLYGRRAGDRVRSAG